MTSKRTKSNDWKLKSADCRKISYPSLSPSACLGFKLTISGSFRSKWNYLGLFEGWTDLFDMKFTSVLNCKGFQKRPASV